MHLTRNPVNITCAGIIVVIMGVMGWNDATTSEPKPTPEKTHHVDQIPTKIDGSTINRDLGTPAPAVKV